MASGDVVCSVPTNSAMCMAEVEATVREQAGVPEREQRLFLDGKELALSASLPMANSTSPLMLVRTTSDPRVTNLAHFHIPAKFDAVPMTGFTMVRKIARGINGDVFRYR